MSLYAMRYRAASGTRHTHHIAAGNRQAASNAAFDYAEKLAIVFGFSLTLA